MFSKLNSGALESQSNEFNDVEIEDLVDRIPDNHLNWNKSKFTCIFKHADSVTLWLLTFAV